MEMNSNNYTYDSKKLILWKKDKTYLDIGIINNQDTILTYHSGNSSVDKFNEKLIQLILKFNYEYGYHYINHDIHTITQYDIKGYIVKTLLWRHCSAYLVVQLSSVGHRYLCYFYDNVTHSVTSFGTSYTSVRKKDIIYEFKKLYKNDLSMYPELQEVLKNNDFEENFGI